VRRPQQAQLGVGRRAGADQHHRAGRKVEENRKIAHGKPFGPPATFFYIRRYCRKQTEEYSVKLLTGLSKFHWQSAMEIDGRSLGRRAGKPPPISKFSPQSRSGAVTRRRITRLRR